MAYQKYNDDRGFQQRGFSNQPRQMFNVSAMGLKCAECGIDITELPFQPSLDRPVYCQECNRNRKRSFQRNRY